MPKLLDDIFEERYAAVIVCDGPDEDGLYDAVAYGPEQECPHCNDPDCRAWEFYLGVSYQEKDRWVFDEQGAEGVGDCRGQHSAEPLDETGDLMRP